MLIAVVVAGDLVVFVASVLVASVVIVVPFRCHVVVLGMFQVVLLVVVVVVASAVGIVIAWVFLLFHCGLGRIYLLSSAICSCLGQVFAMSSCTSLGVCCLVCEGV